jgi:uncharacterized membrane protein
MTWLQRYQLRDFFRNSVWLPPFIGMLAAILAHRSIRWLDETMGWSAALSADGARAILAALSSSMLTFIVFVFSILLLAVQLASAQLSPRIIAGFYRTPILKFSLTVFVFAFTFTLAAMARIGDSVNELSLWVAVYGSVASIGVFLYMIDKVGKSLRPVSILTGIGNEGQKVIEEVYPRLVAGTEDTPTNVALALPGKPSRIVATTRTGVVLAFDVDGLVALARGAGCLVELVPQVGDFMTGGDPLFRLYGSADAIADRELDHAVAIGPERTMQQDPEFAFRIVVDIASKALSPAINDPTTGVLALDQIHRLLRSVGARQLDTGRHRDESGALCLAYRTPDWEDFVSLAITEIRQFGGTSIQIARRMRAMLENLISVVPPQRAVALRAELELLSRGVQREFPDPEDRVRASSADSLGVGGTP